MCAGLVSGTLLEDLAAAGIVLPAAVVQSRIDSYHLCTVVGCVTVRPPGQARPGAALHRGGGPRDAAGLSQGFDGFLLGWRPEWGHTAFPPA